MANDSQKDRLLEHSYDGIQEYDNPMPRWWVISFWATIIFAVLYYLNVGGIGSGAGRIAAYEQEMAAFRAAHPVATAEVPAEVLLALAQDPQQVVSGKATYAKTCAPCHAIDGGGIIGPNLADEYWIHGGSIAQIHTTVFDGVPAKGMPAWGKILKPAEVQQVVAYLWGLRGSTPAKPKPPQGDRVPQ